MAHPRSQARHDCFRIGAERDPVHVNPELFAVFPGVPDDFLSIPAPPVGQGADANDVVVCQHLRIGGCDSHETESGGIFADHADCSAHGFIMSAGHFVPEISEAVLQYAFFFCLTMEAFEVIGKFFLELSGIDIQIEKVNFFPRFPIPCSEEKPGRLKHRHPVFLYGFFRQTEIVRHMEFLAVKVFAQFSLPAVIDRSVHPACREIL